MASSSSGPPGGRATNLYEGKPTEATAPLWADPSNGNLQILLLRATGDKVLPSNPFVVSKTITSAVKDFNSAKPQRDEKKNLQYILTTRNEETVGKLLQINKLIDNTPVEVIFHPTLNQRKCVVTCRDVITIPETELVKELSDQKVIDVKRITRKDGVDIIPTATLIITIRGTVVPEFIYFGFIRAGTRNYYPNPMQCFKCYNFGHTSKRCKREDPLCRNCSKEHPKDFNFKLCNSPALCINCQGNHSSSSRKCPVWLKQNEITKIRIDRGISYKEAKIISNTQNGPTFSSVLQDRLANLQKPAPSCNCKCNCASAASATSSRESTPPIDTTFDTTMTDSTTGSSSTESESESVVSMDTSDAPNKHKNKRKIAKGSSSDSDQRSEDETQTNKDKKRTKNEQKPTPPTNNNNTTPTNNNNNNNTHQSKNNNTHQSKNNNNAYSTKNNNNTHTNTPKTSTPNKNDTYTPKKASLSKGKGPSN